MNKLFRLILASSTLIACDNAIKNPNSEISVENGTETADSNIVKSEFIAIQHKEPYDPNNPFVGYWVGYFEQDKGDASFYIDEGYFWNRENKINISIDQINDTLVKGHSVVAGNSRSFKGKITQKVDTLNDIEYAMFSVTEPGDHKYDGTFTFKILDSLLIGSWIAFGDIEVKYRKYKLQKQSFKYNSDLLLEHSKRYIDWENYLQNTEEIEWEEGADGEEWVIKEFSSATEKIYEVNAQIRY